MTLATGFTSYKGYIVQRQHSSGPRAWAAFAVGGNVPWFQGATKAEVLRQVDEALAEVPE